MASWIAPLISVVGGGIAGIIGGNKDKKTQEKENAKARQENYEYNEMAAENAHQRTLELQQNAQENASYQSKIEDAKAAGVSPALAVEGAGGGGSGSGGSGAQGAGTSGIAPINIAELAQVGLNKRMAGVETYKNIAEAQKTKAEADKVKAETDKIKRGEKRDQETHVLNLESLTEDIKNKQVQRTGMILQNEFDQIRNEGAKQINDHTIANMVRQGELLEQQVREAERNNEIGEETRETVILTMKQELINAIADGAVKNSQASYNYARIKDLADRLKIDERGLDLQERAIMINERKYELTEMLTTFGIGVEGVNKVKDFIVGTAKSAGRVVKEVVKDKFKKGLI